MTRLIQIARIAGQIPVALAVAALFVMMVMTFADVMLRSTINTPIEAATELTRILMAILVFSALPVVSGQGKHIAVDLLDPWFSRIAGRVRDVAISLVCGAMLWWPAERVVVLAERARDYGDVTEYLGIPQLYIAWFIAVATYMTGAVLIARAAVLVFAPSALEAGK